ncbi:unnamed protein product [Hymenolepis diminuta]|uniref:Uncharacterized protein n=1 Tax=Hymenolepis diminuta TaxID=6216 RepID=A0A564YUN9_HYMDI|nr:unnamed protein product [Hymenolepis diminuta]
MRFEATFLEKTISKDFYVTDRNIDLMSLDWRKRNLPDTYSQTYKCGKSCERMQPVSTCCRNSSSFYSYSIAETRFSQDSALTNHSGPTTGATCTTVMYSHSERSGVILLSPTGRSAISTLLKLLMYQKRSLRTQVHSLNLHFA